MLCHPLCHRVIDHQLSQHGIHRSAKPKPTDKEKSILRLSKNVRHFRMPDQSIEGPHMTTDDQGNISQNLPIREQFKLLKC